MKDHILYEIPIYSKEELLEFIVNQKITTAIKIVTNTGRSYEGSVVNISKNKETVLLIKLKEKGILHICTHSIESIELPEDNNTVKILSKGNFYCPKEYGTSGKLQVKKALQQFSETVIKNTSVNTGVPEIVFPTDEHKLNRIIVLTKQLEQVVLSVLKDADARQSWTSKFNKISFIENKTLKVTACNKTMEIHFPFTDIKQPEIQQEESINKILSVL